VDPATIDVVAMSHLHFDHAGGLLAADGSRAFPRARIVAQRAEWEIAMSDNSRVVASYVQPELGLVRDWGAEGWADGEREVLPGVSVVRPAATRPATRASSSGAGPGADRGLFGDLAMRRSANPRCITARRLPLDSVEVKAGCSARPPTGLSRVARAGAPGRTPVLTATASLYRPL
jgi:hypothetical protein